MPSLRQTLSENLKKVRHERGLSQEDLAHLCGLHRTYISDVERCSRNISIDSIEKIAIALSLSAADLLRG